MIPFLKWNKLYLAVSTFFLAIGIASMIFWGFEYSIEFVGGSNIEYQLGKDVSRDQVVQVLRNSGVEFSTVDVADSQVSIRSKALSEQEEAALRANLGNQLRTQVTILRTETVGPSMSQDTVYKTIFATGIAVIGILLYISFAFKNVNFAIAAIVALFHDVLILMGSYSIISHVFGAEFDMLFVTAALTTMSFSVHDTIVMFDQMRSYMRKFGQGDTVYYANRAITETIMRSINNSVTIIFMLLALVFLGGTSIRYFAIALLIGTIVGTYSSPFVSIPIAVWLEKRKKK